MDALKRLSFKAKFTVTIIAIAGLFLLSSIVALMVNQTLSTDAQKIADDYLPEINYLLQADRDLYQAQIAERSILFLPTGNPQINAFKDQYLENVEQAKNRVQKFFDSAQDESLNSYNQNFTKNYEQWLQLTKQYVMAKAQGDTITKDSEKLIADSEQSFQAMRTVLDELGELRLAQVTEFTSEIKTHSSESQTLLLGILIIGMAVSLAVVLFIPGLVVQPLKKVSDRLLDISEGEGDLTARIELKQNDELGKMVLYFNNFMDKLQDVIGTIQSTASSVEDNTFKLSADAATSKDSIDHQHQALTQVATAVNEMAAAIQEVAQNTSDTADEARKASSLSESGQNIVHSTTTQIQALAEQVQTAAGMISHVEEEANNVNSVIDVIGGIAEQTNLLALNAAIEAARAGEQGRGFAVVADEVRTLASRTQESTQDIQRMLQKLQQGVTDAVTAMNTSSDSAQKTVETTQGASSTLDQIQESVSNIARMAIQIATAADEQSEVTEDINRNLTEINTYAETSAEIATSTQEASAELQHMTKHLNDAVQNFKV
ncbi:MAG: methyl-accepting chemotaxis protein [Pseudomonadales bacterium]|nr:methyl-accepting chemotaxis protein [Pseudomonadales bacterium]